MWLYFATFLVSRDPDWLCSLSSSSSLPLGFSLFHSHLKFKPQFHNPFIVYPSDNLPNPNTSPIPPHTVPCASLLPLFVAPCLPIWLSMLATSAVASLPLLPPVRRGGRHIDRNVVATSSFPRGICNSPKGLGTTNNSISRKFTQFPFGAIAQSAQTAVFICAAASNARCGAEQTQTVTRQAPTITHIPGKEKSPELDDGGTGFPPRDDDGGGGGGGGGGNWSGGFFFFGFLAFLGFLKDKESENTYRDNRRR
ncbi:hypothetical protein RJT34_12766 [Clitoria ternatea]|uniref:Uncharacterized protein n=1 Tax=Clitoria ternatea TaxID=43366 RepID=A0AAN9JPF5_CLITE